MFGMGMGELLVLALVGLFVLGPERLPGALRTVARLASQAKQHLAGFTDQLNSPEFAEVRRPFDELREPLAQLRAADPRQAWRQALRGEPTAQAPAPNTPTPEPTAPPASSPAPPPAPSPHPPLDVKPPTPHPASPDTDR